MDALLRGKAEELAKEIAVSISTQQELGDVMRLMTKSVIERMLDAEMDVHLDQQRGVVATTAPTQAAAADAPTTGAATGRAGTTSGRNRRNGKSAKTVQGESGRLTITTPRDRNSTFEPLLIPKHERRLAGFDDKVLALYAKGMSTRDIQELVKTLYGVELSATLISSLTDAVDEEVTAWRSRPLESVWPIVYFDGIVVHVRGASGRVSQHTIYVALGVNLDGKKELLGLWLAENEGAKFWLQVLTDLKNRGLNDIFVACVDGLAGFPDAIRTAYPQTKVQLCIVHLVRAALRYVADQDSKAVVRDLKKHLSGGDAARSGASPGGFRSSVAGEVSDNRENVAVEMDRHHHAVRFSRPDPQGDLDDQCDRVGEQRDPKVHPQPEDLSERGVGIEDHVHGDSRGVEEMDDAH